MYNYKEQIEELIQKAKEAKAKGEFLSFNDILKDFEKEDRPRAINDLLGQDLLKVFKK